MEIQNIRYLSNADNFVMAHGYETIRIRLPLSYHWHLNICLTWASRSKEMEITWVPYSWLDFQLVLVLRLGGYRPTSLQSQSYALWFPSLQTLYEILGWQEICITLTWNKLSLRGSRHLSQICSMPEYQPCWHGRTKHLSLCCDYMEVWCAPFATHLPCIYEVKMMFLASECLLFFWNSFWVRYRKTTTRCHNSSLFV
jgi:hypothetical protein